MGMIPQYSHCPKQIKVINPKNLQREMVFRKMI